MIFCTHCGSKQQEDMSFCQDCGKALVIDNTPSPQRTQKQGLTTKQKKQLLGIIGASVLVFGIYKGGETLADGTKTAESFREAVMEKDADRVLSHLTARDADVELTEKHAKDLIDYYHGDSPAMNHLSNYLEEKTFWIQQGSNPAMAAGNSTSGIHSLSFENTGNQWLFFDKYEFVVDSFPLEVYSNQTDLTFSVDGEEVQHEISSDGLYLLGNYPPGDYEITGELDSNFVQLESTVEKHHFYNEPIDLWFDVDEIQLQANVNDSKLFINDEDTGRTIGIDSEYIGPVLLDGSMDFHIEKEAPFGIVSSQKVAVQDYSMELALQANEEIIADVKEDLSQILEGDGFTRLQNNNNTIEILESIEIYTDSTSIENTGSQWKIWIHVRENWQSESWTDDEVDMVPYERERDYELLYNTDSESWALLQTEGTYATLEGSSETISFEYEDRLKALISEKEEDAMATHRENEEDNLFYLFNSFISSNVNAINGGHTDDVVSYIDPKATDYIDTVVDYADHLIGRNISQSFQGVEIIDFSSSDDEHYEVTTFEDYIIYYDDNDEVKRKTFESHYDVRLTTEGFKVVELLETTEQSSEDL